MQASGFELTTPHSRPGALTTRLYTIHKENCICTSFLFYFAVSKWIALVTSLRPFCCFVVVFCFKRLYRESEAQSVWGNFACSITFLTKFGLRQFFCFNYQFNILVSIFIVFCTNFVLQSHWLYHFASRDFDWKPSHNRKWPKMTLDQPKVVGSRINCTLTRKKKNEWRQKHGSLQNNFKVCTSLYKRNITVRNYSSYSIRNCQIGSHLKWGGTVVSTSRA